MSLLSADASVLALGAYIDVMQNQKGQDFATYQVVKASDGHPSDISIDPGQAPQPLETIVLNASDPTFTHAARHAIGAGVVCTRNSAESSSNFIRWLSTDVLDPGRGDQNQGITAGVLTLGLSVLALATDVAPASTFTPPGVRGKPDEHTAMRSRMRSAAVLFAGAEAVASAVVCGETTYSHLRENGVDSVKNLWGVLLGMGSVVPKYLFAEGVNEDALYPLIRAIVGATGAQAVWNAIPIIGQVVAVASLVGSPTVSSADCTSGGAEQLAYVRPDQALVVLPSFVPPQAGPAVPDACGVDCAPELEGIGGDDAGAVLDLWFGRDGDRRLSTTTLDPRPLLEIG
jgi:hypothetical protein